MFKNLFGDFEPLYHFTKFESAVRILASHKIRFGKMNKMNDPNESFRSLFISSNSISDDDSFKILPIVRKELNHYEQISFSSDNRINNGFSLRNMWGFYGDCGYGVCIVFDKRFILEDLHPRQYGRVKYKRNYDSSILISNITSADERIISKYIGNHTRSFFFKKSKEWEYEQEFRIVSRFEGNDYNYLVLDKNWYNSVKCVIFNKAIDVEDGDYLSNSSSVKALKQLIPDGCVIAQLCKNLNGNDILCDMNGELLWGESFDNNISINYK